MFGMPNAWQIMAIGQALHGVFDPILLIPSLSEMTEVALENRKVSPEEEEIINDLTSGIFNFFIGLG